ncbi:MAG: transglutaminase family protein [Candidatus Sumerlaeaceae bacterium]|nr:transglutaminase family protein [Candidatus Sumerlaeaceae bacterium]
MHYTIRHITRFHYTHPVSESLTEARMQPITDANQRCLNFELSTSPEARIMSYRDHLGNIVHNFDIPGHHSKLTITAKALVDVQDPAPLPDSLPISAWKELDSIVSRDDFYEILVPSPFTQATPLLAEFTRELAVGRDDDPLTLLHRINSGIFQRFDYAPQTTRVDSPIDDALRARKGVCQDFSHIMIALVRQVGIPCRYVSGYLFHRTEDHDRSAADSSHAWVEALLPGIGWVGFDPTNNLVAGGRHIRVAVGCDYADVPPTRGVFKGQAKSELSVAVSVLPSTEPAPTQMNYSPILSIGSHGAEPDWASEEFAQQIQQQQ